MYLTSLNQMGINIGIAGFSAFVFSDRFVERKSSVPTNFLEDGSFASDHIIVEPITLNISGSVADIHINLSSAVSSIIKSTSAAGRFLGLFDNNKTIYQLQKINDIATKANDKLNKIDNSVNSVRNIVDIFGNKGGAIAKQFVDAMNTLVDTKQLIPIETRFKTYENMAITSFSTREDNKGDIISFSLSAQEIRFAQTEYTDTSKYMKSPSSPDQISSNVDKGVQTGEVADNATTESTLSKVWNSL